MLAETLTFALLIQQSFTPSWVETGMDREQPTATVVKGTAELDLAAAYETAHREAVLSLRQRYEDRAEQIVGDIAPAWLPSLITDKTVRRWLARMDLPREVRVLDRSDRERHHEFGSSYQTSLLVVDDPELLERATSRLGRDLRRAEREFLARSGGTLGFWVILALGAFWLDRLSRGYMTGRLTFLALATGVAVPVVLFLI